ncbi:PocR ligand-binding domain-containing protein [Desulforhopalus sp. 52FAK]
MLALSLLDLVEKEKLDEILEKMTIATGVSCIITNIDGTPLTTPQNFSSLCRKYCRSTPEGIKRCQQSDEYGGVTSAKNKEFVIYECFNAGLLDSAAPIIVNGKHIASVLMGQVLDKKIDRDVAIERARRIGIVDIEGYLQELDQVPILGADQLEKIAGLMEVITRTISELAIQKHLILKRSRRYLERMINSVSDCIIATDEKSFITMINDGGAEMFGYKKDDMIGLSFKSLFVDFSPIEVFQKHVGDKVEGQCRIDLNACAVNDRTFPVQLAVSNITNDGVGEGFVAVLRDVSEEKKMEIMKEDLVGMLTHDMGNPILSIQSVLRLLVDEELGELNDIQLETLRLALGTGNQLHGIVSDFLDIYRSENGRFLLRKQLVNVELILTKSIEMVELFSREKNVEIVRLFEGDSFKVDGDYTRLLRTFTNFLTNSIAYSQKGQTVLVSVKRAKLENHLLPAAVSKKLDTNRNYCHIKIIDRGPGIPLKMQEKIFDKFFSIKNGNGPIQGRSGTGLGLAFCRLVVQAHEGVIWVKSPVNKYSEERRRGSCFNVILPLVG